MQPAWNISSSGNEAKLTRRDGLSPAFFIAPPSSSMRAKRGETFGLAAGAAITGAALTGAALTGAVLTVTT